MIYNQKIDGNNNMQAARDIYNFTEYKPKSIHFYEQDIKDVIDLFSKGFNRITFGTSDGAIGDIEDTFDYIEKEEKNRLNSLSDDYFDYILSEHLQYFYRIDEFLKDPKNSDLLKKYKDTAFEINFQIQTIGSSFSSFDRILGELYNGMSEKDTCGFAEKRDLYILFFNFMYWNCDIGKKR